MAKTNDQLVARIVAPKNPRNICPHCGASNSSTAKVCRDCKQSLDEE